MKCSESWLRQWVNPSLSREALCEALTMAGLEVDAQEPVAPPFHGVVVGQVLQIEPHPQADRLQVCKVQLAQEEMVQIVCGAPNVSENMKTAVAKISAVLPGKAMLVAAPVRGVLSEGMICSKADLGLAEDNEGLLVLPADAQVGQDLRDYLQLSDYAIDIAITPNRGDCLSIQGLAREVSAITQTPLTAPSLVAVPPSHSHVLPITVEAPEHCPRYLGRIISGIKSGIVSPVWLQEKLRRSGMRSISPVVDITNYVMLELGQPMHAFDLKTIHQGLCVRLARPGEKIRLLNETEQELNSETLLIADSEKPLAIAGLMGGMDSCVVSTTQDIFLESAFFNPASIAKQRQYYGISSESSYRFERGVDPTLQRQAMERATQLILAIVGGEAGPLSEKQAPAYLPTPTIIRLHPDKLHQVLGIVIPHQQVESIFQALGFSWQVEKEAWQVRIPAYRSDLTREEDLIEEAARLYGFDKIPPIPLVMKLQPNTDSINKNTLKTYRLALKHQEFYEVVTYSFIDKKLQEIFFPREPVLTLSNPISSDMAVMRTHLWPGLVSTFLYNKSRQQQRAKLFEIGLCFIPGKELLQQSRLGGMIVGTVDHEQWGITSRSADFFDLKGAVENLLSEAYGKQLLTFKPIAHDALHPGQAASIYYQDQKIGLLGQLHPRITEALDISERIYLFELELSLLPSSHLFLFKEISKFPAIRRDIAIIVDQGIPSDDIQDTIKEIAGPLLQEVFVFDVYQGKGVVGGRKSIAIALILQDVMRTLVEEEVAVLLARVIGSLKGKFGAELRS